MSTGDMYWYRVDGRLCGLSKRRGDEIWKCGVCHRFMPLIAWRQVWRSGRRHRCRPFPVLGRHMYR